MKHDYVIKEIKVIDFKTSYYRIKKYPRANIHTMSRKKSFPNYVITKIWDYMDTMHTKKWENIADGFLFILEAKKINDIVFDKQDKEPNKKYNLLKVNNYNKTKVHTIYISKSIL